MLLQTVIEVVFNLCAQKFIEECNQQWPPSNSPSLNGMEISLVALFNELWEHKLKKKTSITVCNNIKINITS